MRPSEILRKHLSEVRQLTAARRVSELRVFGSVARNEDTDASDVDLLAIYAADATIFDHAAFAHAMKALLRADCDILSDEILDKSGFEQMMRQSITLDDFENRRFTARGAVAKEERQSAGDENLRWILRRISETVGDAGEEALLSDSVRCDALAYQFQLLASIAGNADGEAAETLIRALGADPASLAELPEMLLTTTYPRMLVQAARQIRAAGDRYRW